MCMKIYIRPSLKYHILSRIALKYHILSRIVKCFRDIWLSRYHLLHKKLEISLKIKKHLGNIFNREFHVFPMQVQLALHAPNKGGTSSICTWQQKLQLQGNVQPSAILR